MILKPRAIVHLPSLSRSVVSCVSVSHSQYSGSRLLRAFPSMIANVSKQNLHLLNTLGKPTLATVPNCASSSHTEDTEYTHLSNKQQTLRAPIPMLNITIDRYYMDGLSCLCAHRETLAHTPGPHASTHTLCMVFPPISTSLCLLISHLSWTLHNLDLDLFTTGRPTAKWTPGPITSFSLFLNWLLGVSSIGHRQVQV